MSDLLEEMRRTGDDVACKANALSKRLALEVCLACAPPATLALRSRASGVLLTSLEGLGGLEEGGVKGNLLQLSKRFFLA